MTDYEKELVSIGIEPKKAEKMVKKFKKSEKTWSNLLSDLKKLPTENAKNSVIDKILSQEEKEAEIIETKKVKVTTKNEKFPKIAELAKRFLEEERKIRCLKGENKYKTKSEKYDVKKECVGSATYVCHHCGRNMCSQHSYWVPDEEFPYVLKKTEEEMWVVDEKKAKKAKNIIGIGVFLFIIGIVVIPFGSLLMYLAIGLFIAALVAIILGYMMLKRAKKLSAYPQFIKRAETKWDRDLYETYEHRGYYVAVHCWDCLRENHRNYVQTAQKILDEVYKTSKNWRKRYGAVVKKIPEDLRISSAVYAANKYLDEFKFGEYCYMPLDGKLRNMSRPAFLGKKKSSQGSLMSSRGATIYENPIGTKVKGDIASSSILDYLRKREGGYSARSDDIYPPTPIWVFEQIKNLKAGKAPTFSVDKWIQTNTLIIKKSFGIKLSALEGV